MKVLSGNAERLLSVCYSQYNDALRGRFQHAGTELDDGDDIEQQHERAKRERNRDRPHPLAALLLLSEHEAVLAIGFFHVISPLTPATGRSACRSHDRPGARRTARRDRG